MEPKNLTFVLQFLLLGFTDDPELQSLIFIIFLSIYLVTILGNLLIILGISFQSHLHTPMYFFLSNLSFNDIGFSTATVIKMLMSIQEDDQSITYTGCLTQLSFVLVFAYFENFLLTVMAYDHYVAICHPLKYTIIMNPNFCFLLSLISLFISIMDALMHTLMVQRLSFCTDLEIPHFFCELDQIIKLSCSDTLIDNIVVFAATCIFGGIPVCGIIYSYYHIVASVLRITSLEGKYKAFSTCGTHLSVVSLFYGAGSMVYISSAMSVSPRKSAVASVMYSVLLQMMNPFIYSLRNKDMKVALRNLLSRIVSLE
ncbi:olfactory receptor 7G2-like [Mesocricetus auratus]|uniref:Olfactory receptor 7G2-like n=1 Tax=Mesocricetus auratus TaxID=10036 RepID=A0A1U7RF65_MESAU|nr:olfactory receptor 7G2-like [Mesocricetus auratus]